MALLFVVGAAGTCAVSGLASDTKPSPTNSFTFYETDTARNYIADGAQWNLVLDLTDYASAAQGVTADSALQPAGNGGSLTGLTKAQVGLGNVDNTTDAGKPISTATQTALDAKQASGSYATGTGSANGTNTGDQTSIVGITGTIAQFNTALSDGNFATGGGTATGTNTGDQTITLTGGVTGSGTSSFAATVVTNANLTGHVTSSGNAAVLGSFTIAQLSTAISDANISGNNTGDQTSIVGISGTLAEFNTALSDANFASGGGTVTGTDSGTNTGDNATNTQYSGLAASKQDTLVSATNIKTINGSTVLGSGDLVVGGAVAWGSVTGTLSAQTDLQTALDAKQVTLVSATNIKTINGSTVLGSGDLVVSGAFGATQATVTLPFALRSHRVTVTDAAVSPSSKIILSLAGVPDTQENAGDDVDVLSMQAVPGSGSFQFQAAFLTPMRGPLKINYAIGS